MKCCALTLTLALAAGSLPAAWRDMNCPEVQRPTEARYEAVTDLSPLTDDAGPWTVVRGGQQASARLERLERLGQPGLGSRLHVDYEFGGEKDLEYVELAAGIEIPKPIHGIGLWVRQLGDPPVTLRLRLRDSTGETHQISVSRPHPLPHARLRTRQPGPAGRVGGGLSPGCGGHGSGDCPLHPQARVAVLMRSLLEAGHGGQPK